MLNSRNKLIEYLIEEINELEDFLIRMDLYYSPPLGMVIEEKDKVMLNTIYELAGDVIKENRNLYEEK